MSTAITIRFPASLGYPPQKLAVWYEKLLTKFSIRESDLCEHYRTGQSDDFMCRVFPAIWPDGISQKFGSDLAGVDPSVISVWKKLGRVTLPVLIQCLRAFGDSFDDIGPFPPGELMVLAGMRTALPSTVQILSQRGPTRGLSHHYAKEELSLADVGLLYCLIQAPKRPEQWIRHLSSSRHDARAVLKCDAFVDLITTIYSEARDLVSFDAQAAESLEPQPESSGDIEGQLRRLANLWNQYLQPWNLAYEAVSTMILGLTQSKLN